MKRDLTKLTENVYDLLIIGGGIYGACVAWDANLRGLKVALVEKADFGSATSANSLKTIHGGLRYLQHADFKRMRESITERRTLMQIAPHLVHPLPVVIPTYGHGMRGKEVMAIALMVNDLVSCDRNLLSDPQKHIPTGRIISKQECLHLVPGIYPQNLTGGAIFHDAQVYNSERLVLEFLRSAAKAGATVANYVEVIRFLQKGTRVIGVEAKDLLTGNQLDIQAQTVVNTSGPWINQVLNRLNSDLAPAIGGRARCPSHNKNQLVGQASSLPFIGRATPPYPPLVKGRRGGCPSHNKNQFAVGQASSLPFIGQHPSCGIRFAKAINLVTRQLFPTYAVGISGQNSYQDSDALIKKGSNLLFIAPWRGKSLIGTKYTVCDRHPDDFQVTENDIQEFLAQINQAYPAAKLTREDVSFVHGGLLPSSSIHPETGDVQLCKHYQIYDYREQGLQGLISVVGVKYTTARHVAQNVVDRVFASRGQKPPKSVSSVTPLHGGQISQFETFLHAEIAKRPYGLGEEVIRRLVYNYGSAYGEVLKYLEKSETLNKEGAGEQGCRGGFYPESERTDNLSKPALLGTGEPESVLRAEVLHGVREEMAQKLSDVIFRRTELGSAGHPGNEALSICAETMGAELGWSSTKIQQELQQVNEVFAFGHTLSQERSDESKLASKAI